MSRELNTRVPASMDDRSEPMPPGMTLVRLASRLVSSESRDEWLAEWLGELSWSWIDGHRRGVSPIVIALQNRWRALGAISDAYTLRRPFDMHDIGHDFRYAARSLRRRPGFAAVVVLTLALGIGATTAIFSVVHGVLLRPLEFRRPEQLVLLEGEPTDGDREKVSPGMSYPDFLDLRAQTTAFQQMAVAHSVQAVFTRPDAEPMQVPTGLVSAGWLSTFGVRPIIGRDFTSADEQPGAEPVVLLAHSFWRTRLGGDPRVIGQSIHLDGVPVTVIGVLPPTLRLAAVDMQIMRVIVPGPLDRVRGKHWLSVVGRLKDGVSRERAAAEARAVAKRLELQYPADNAKRSVSVTPLQDALVGEAKPALLVLLGAVALVLVIGCTNLASLFLARAASREREMAVRAALGANSHRLARQWLTESLLLSVVGAAIGLAIAWAGMRALLVFAPQSIPRANEVSLDGTVLSFLVAVSVATALLFGILPAWQRRREPLTLAALREGARGATSGRKARRLREVLVVAEIALAMVLAVGAMLLGKSYWRLTRSPLSIDPSGMIVTHIQLPAARYDSVSRVLGFYASVLDQVRAIPGVREASVSYEHPVSQGWTSSYVVMGRERPAPGHEPEARVRPVTPGYFHEIGLPLRRGRDVSADDRMGAPGAVVVNESFVRRHFQNVDPIGQVLDRRNPWWPGQPTQFRIVGVVADEPFMGLGASPEPATYFPYGQFPFNDMWLVVKTDGDAKALVPAIRQRVWKIDRDIPLDRFDTMTELLGASVAAPRFNATLISLFAATALLLAAIGIYGVLSYTVAQRTNEIGVRMALGAARGRVVTQIVGHGLGVAVAGVAMGIIGSLAATRALQTLLVGVSERDPLVIGACAVLLTLVSAGAAWIPARRASRVEPVTALRYD